jgi:hypothetical protein
MTTGDTVANSSYAWSVDWQRRMAACRNVRWRGRRRVYYRRSRDQIGRWATARTYQYIIRAAFGNVGVFNDTS